MNIKIMNRNEIRLRTETADEYIRLTISGHLAVLRSVSVCDLVQEKRGSNSCDYLGCDLVSREFMWSFSLCLKIGYSLSFCNSAGSEFQSFVPKKVMLFLNFSLLGFLLVINFFLLLLVVMLQSLGFQLLKFLSLVV